MTRLSLVFGLIALVLTVWTVGIDVVAHHLWTIGPWFALVIAIETAATCCDAGAVYLLSRGPGAPSYRNACVAMFAGGAVNSVTPGGNLGEALKVSLLARSCSTQRIIAAVLYVLIGSVIVLLAAVSAGSIATAFLFAMPPAAATALIAAGMLAATISIGLVVLVRRGMTRALAQAAQRIRLISAARNDRWREQLESLDARLRGSSDSRSENHRSGAALLVIISQVLKRGAVATTIVATGYALDPAQLIAVLSAGVLLQWLSALVPMGIGVSEGSNGALFAVIGAPTSIGVAVALARRVNQIVFAAIGFAVLAIDRIAHQVDPRRNWFGAPFADPASGIDQLDTDPSAVAAVPHAAVHSS